MFTQAPAPQSNPAVDILQQALQETVPTLAQQPVLEILSGQSSALLTNDPPILKKQTQGDAEFSEEDFDVNEFTAIGGLSVPVVTNAATPSVVTPNALTKFAMQNDKFPAETISTQDIPDGQMEYFSKLQEAKQKQIKQQKSSYGDTCCEQIPLPCSTASPKLVKRKHSAAFMESKPAKPKKAPTKKIVCAAN